jgi:hypothetical protein
MDVMEQNDRLPWRALYIPKAMSSLVLQIAPYRNFPSDYFDLDEQVE